MYFHNFSKQQTTGTSAVLKHYYQNSYRDYSIYSGKMQTRSEDFPFYKNGHGRYAPAPV